MRAIIIISSVLAAFLFSPTSAAPDKVVCYYNSQAASRTGNGTFTVDNIDPKLCTHLIYAFVGLNMDGTIKVLNTTNDLEDNDGVGEFERFVNLKKNAFEVKILVAIGGWNEGGSAFSKVVGNDSLRSIFVENVIKFVQKYKFDGIDLDWEYPGNTNRGGRPKDVKNFNKLIIDLRAAMQFRGLILTAAVAAAESAINKYYDVPQLSKYLDFINVMTYDLHGKTGINAPLHARAGDSNPELNVKTCIEAWIRKGADPTKIILGIATYGRSFTLPDKNKRGVGAKSTGAGKPGNCTLSYNEIVEMLKDGQLTEIWDDEQQIPYAYKKNQWIGYDNEKSIKLKCAFAKQKGLGGAMIWSIDMDDFRGVSGKKYALLNTINEAFGRIV